MSERFNDDREPKPCAGLINLNKANDQHLLLALACFNLVRDKLEISAEEAARYIQAAGQEVAQVKLALFRKTQEKTEDPWEGLIKAVKFDA